MEYDTDIEKITFIRFYIQDYRGWLHVEWDKEDKDKTYIIVKFNSYNAMQLAIKRFNRLAERVGSYMRLKPKTYFKVGCDQISSREFKITIFQIMLRENKLEKACDIFLKENHFLSKTQDRR